MFDSFRVRRRVQELEEDFAKLRRDFMSLEAEWSNSYDKLRAMMQRIAKRAEVAEKAADAEHPEASGSTSAGPGRFLTPRQLQIQQQILRRRTNGGE